MSANNTFNMNRFLMLFKQHSVHNLRIMLYSVIGFCGIVFLILSFVQLSEDFEPFTFEEFVIFWVAFMAIFGVLFVGYSFPSFRSKETTISYLTVPASQLEKFLFELIYRVGSTLVILPFLYWLTFHLEGYFFQLISSKEFTAIGFSDFSAHINVENFFWASTMVVSLVVLCLALPFAGAAHFTKQPLVKSLFLLAILIVVFVFFVFIVFEVLGLDQYSVNESVWLLPTTQEGALRFFTFVFSLSSITMLVVAFLKLKEKTV